MRRMTLWLAMFGASLALVVAACGGSSTGSAAPSTAGQASLPPTLAPSAAPSAAESSAASNEPSIAIPSFDLPSDDKGLEALLPDQICGAKALKISFSGERFMSSADPTFASILAQLGKTPADVSMAVAAGTSTGSCNTAAGVFRIKGVDAGRLRDVYLAETAKEGETTTRKNLGGKDVDVTSGDTTTYVYYKGDAIFFVTAKDDAATAAVLQGMP